jgi:energy-coupling factor transporter ATP-binding protein EcfA2
MIVATPDDQIFTEKLAFADLVGWSRERPAWQQDALRRLILNDVLSEHDIGELTVICSDPKSPSEPLSVSHVSNQSVNSEPIALLEIRNPTGINALATDQKLQFAPTGLTIIYGDNGSGKSGYVRVLKHACRTRDRGNGNAILGDIEANIVSPQSATIVFSRGAAQDTFNWTPDGEGHPDLPSVSIFDSRSANIHVEKTNAVAYIPQPMKILEDLASACDQIKAALESKQAALGLQTPIALKNPKLSPGTAAGSFVRALSSQSNVEQLALLATMSSAERRKLADLEIDLAQDPKRSATRVTDQKDRLDRLVQALGKLASVTTDGAFTTRDKLKDELVVKRDAAKLASEKLFAASPLPEIGQATWRSLWEAARRYSNEVAYPEKSFPEASADDDLCVLCQQPLGEEAVGRRLTFEAYMQGTAKAEEESATIAYNAVVQSVAKNHVPVERLLQLRNLIGSEIGNAELARAVWQHSISVAWRKRAFCANRPVPIPEPNFPQQALAELSNSLAERSAQLAADQSSPQHLALVQELRELKDREALTALLEDIKAEIERRKAIDALNKAIKDTAKRSVTTKNKELSDKMVTNALRGRFAREVEKMKLARMPIELRKIKDQNAVSYFQVCLVEKPDAPVGEIFSEGEHRCVALAAFLAELVTSKQYSGIVFDDPMSSLDHIHRKAVAGRLVEEAAHRQVIIFTHDLAFLYEVRREAEAKERLIAYQTVHRKSSRPGYVDGELPTKAKSAVQVALSLRSELKAVKGQFAGWLEVKRCIFCKGFIEQLREAWDQAIADFIRPVLGRFENQIKGSSLFRLAVLTEDDVRIVTAARGRLSEELHASAETLNPETVTYETLLAEIGKLEAWQADMIKRQKDAKAPVTSYSGA